MRIDGRYTADDIAALLIKQNGFCAGGCNRYIAKRYEVDHIIPLSRGGTNWPSNLQLMCKRCNQSKGASLM